MNMRRDNLMNNILIDSDILLKLLRYQRDNEASYCRVGQFFCNKYIKGVWTELYYEENDRFSATLIAGYMEKHCYSSLKEIPVNKEYEQACIS